MPKGIVANCLGIPIVTHAVMVGLGDFTHALGVVPCGVAARSGRRRSIPLTRYSLDSSSVAREED